MKKRFLGKLKDTPKQKTQNKEQKQKPFWKRVRKVWKRNPVLKPHSSFAYNRSKEKEFTREEVNE